MLWLLWYGSMVVLASAVLVAAAVVVFAPRGEIRGGNSSATSFSNAAMGTESS